MSGIRRMLSFESTEVNRSITSLLAAVAVSLFIVGSSTAFADTGRSRGGRSSMINARQGGQSVGRTRGAVRGSTVRGGRYVGRDRGGKRYGWFGRDRRNYERSFIGFSRGSFRGRSRSSFFFGYSFSWFEYRSYSGSGYRRGMRRDYRSDVPRGNKSSVQRATIEHSPNESGRRYVPLVASDAAPEFLQD